MLIIASLSLFIVDQRQNAIVFRLGEVVRVERTPGLYAKIPLLDNVRFFDTRILTIDSAEPERFLTSEKKNVLVDLFVKWRITDVRQYYVSVGGDEARAQTRLLQTINDSLRAEFGNRTVHEVVSGERDKIMELMRKRANDDAKTIGVEVLDVRMKRVDLPQEVSESVYRRMEAERKRVANELRSTGSAESGENPRRRRPAARGHPRAGLPRRPAHQRRRRCKGDRHLRARLRRQCGVLRVLPQPRGLQAELQEQERRDGARPELRVLQVPEVGRQSGQQVTASPEAKRRPDRVDDNDR